MNFLKRYLKIFIGIAVLIFVVVVFFLTQRSGDLEGANLKKWRSADIERRVAAVKILVASDEHSELLVQCPKPTAISQKVSRNFPPSRPSGAN